VVRIFSFLLFFSHNCKVVCDYKMISKLFSFSRILSFILLSWMQHACFWGRTNFLYNRICIFILSIPHCGNNCVTMNSNHPFYGTKCKYLTTWYPPKTLHDLYHIFTNAGISERCALKKLFLTTLFYAQYCKKCVVMLFLLFLFFFLVWGLCWFRFLGDT